MCVVAVCLVLFCLHFVGKIVGLCFVDIIVYIAY